MYNCLTPLAADLQFALTGESPSNWGDESPLSWQIAISRERAS
ncbi:hypothetical protein ACOZ4N_00915 (plasmid) [Halorientalis pallida]